MKIPIKYICGVLILLLVSFWGLFLAGRTDVREKTEKTNRLLIVSDSNSSISKILKQARPGDTVFVKEGVYEEALYLKKRVNLVGEGKDKVTIRCSAMSQQHVLVVVDSDVLIKGLTIEHVGQDTAEQRAVGIFLIGSSARIEDCRVRNAAGNGLFAKDGGQPLISNCLFESNGFNGIYIVGENTKPKISGNRCLGNSLYGININSCQAEIENNVCNENKSGILVHSQKTKGTLTGNQCYRNKEWGIYIRGGASCNAKDNICNENGKSGIIAYEPNTTCVLVQNKVERNLLNGIRFSDGATGIAERNICRLNKQDGIVVAGKWSTPILRENICSDNAQNGICLSTRQTTVAEDNVCTDNGYSGIAVYAFGAFAKLQRNNCCRNKSSGVWFGRYAGGEVKDNVCAENDEHGICIANILSAPRLVNNKCNGNKGQDIYVEQGDFGNVRLMLIEEKFNELEKIATRLRLENPRGTYYGYQLSNYYNYLALYWEGYKPPLEQSMLEVVEKWTQQKPESITPRIVKAKLLSRSGWRVRGKGFAHTVTEEQWRVFRIENQKAWDVLDDAEKLGTKDPELYATRLDLGKALAKPMREINSIFYKGVEINRSYYPLYQEMARILMPRWFGGPGDLEAFAREAVTLTSSDEGESFYAVVAEVPIPFLSESRFELFLTYGFSYDRLKIAFKDLLKQYPDSNYHINSFCLIASLYKDKKTARELFEVIGDNWEWDVWDYRRVFDKYRSWAYAEDSEEKKSDSI